MLGLNIFKKGGKAFVEGVNVLDSNPKAYKHIKKKIKKHLLGNFIEYLPVINESNIRGNSEYLNDNLDYINLRLDLKRLSELLKIKRRLLIMDSITGGIVDFATQAISLSGVPLNYSVATPTYLSSTYQVPTYNSNVTTIANRNLHLLNGNN